MVLLTTTDDDDNDAIAEKEESVSPFVTRHFPSCRYLVSRDGGLHSQSIRARSGNCLFCEPPGEPPGEPAVMVLFLVIFRVISSRASASAKACDLDSNGRRTAPFFSGEILRLRFLRSSNGSIRRKSPPLELRRWLNFRP